MAVFVLDKKKRPLMPCSEKRARLLLDRGWAVVVKMYPFTIRLKNRVGGDVQPVRIKLDPGSKTTGIAIVRESQAIDAETGEIAIKVSVLWLAELSHRGDRIAGRSIFRRQPALCKAFHTGIAARFNARTAMAIRFNRR